MGSIFSVNSNFDPLLAEQLKGYGDWSFDIDSLSCTENERLVITGMEVFKLLKLNDVLKCSKKVFEAWLRGIVGLYQKYSNAYHNATHAANVLHDTVYLIAKPEVKNMLSGLDRAAVVIAAIVHDAGHPGRTEDFLINTQDPILIPYIGKKSPLERYHLATAFEFTFSTNGVNVLGKLSENERSAVRRSVNSVVLATDLEYHQNYLNTFEEALKKSMVEKKILLQMVLKMSDIGRHANENKLALRD